MYGWAWRKLPGRWPLKALEAIAIVGVLSVVLVVLVFPWVEPKLPFSDNTVDGGGSSTNDPWPRTAGAPGAAPGRRPAMELAANRRPADGSCEQRSHACGPPLSSQPPER